MAFRSVYSAIVETRQNARYAVSVIERDTGCRAYLVHEGEFPLRGDVEQHVYYYAVYWLDWVSQTPLSAHSLKEDNIIVATFSVVGSASDFNSYATLRIMPYKDVFTVVPHSDNESLLRFLSSGEELVSAVDFCLPTERDRFTAKVKEALRKCSDAVVDIYLNADCDEFLCAFTEFIAKEYRKRAGKPVRLTYQKDDYSIYFYTSVAATELHPVELSVHARVVTADAMQRTICGVDIAIGIGLIREKEYSLTIKFKIPSNAQPESLNQVSVISRTDIPSFSELRAEMDRVIKTLAHSHSFLEAFDSLVKDMRTAEEQRQEIISAMLRDADYAIGLITERAIKRALAQWFAAMCAGVYGERGYCDISTSYAMRRFQYSECNFHELDIVVKLSPQAARRNILVYKVPIRIMLRWYRDDAPRITVTSVIEGHAARLAGDSSYIEFTIDCSAAPDLQEVLSIARTILERLLNDQIAVLTAHLLEFFKAHYYDNLHKGKVKVGV